MPGRGGVSSDQAVHKKGERVDGSSSPPRSGGDADSPRVDAAIGVANPQRGLLHAMVSRPVAPSGLPAISPTSTVGRNRSSAAAQRNRGLRPKGGETTTHTLDDTRCRTAAKQDTQRAEKRGPACGSFPLLLRKVTEGATRSDGGRRAWSRRATPRSPATARKLRSS